MKLLCTSGSISAFATQAAFKKGILQLQADMHTYDIAAHTILLFQALTLCQSSCFASMCTAQKPRYVVAAHDDKGDVLQRLVAHAEEVAYNDPPSGAAEQLILNQHLYRLLRHNKLSAFQRFVQQVLLP